MHSTERRNRIKKPEILDNYIAQVESKNFINKFKDK
jgi:hypothetical protein